MAAWDRLRFARTARLAERLFGVQAVTGGGLLTAVVDSGAMTSDLGRVVLDRWVLLVERLGGAERDYCPRPLDVAATVVAASRSKLADRGPRRGWDALLHEANVSVVDDDHDSVLDAPIAGELVALIAGGSK